MRRHLLLLVSVLVTAAVVVPGVLLAAGPAPPPPPSPSAPLRPVAASVLVPDARSLLAAWDERRAAAWAAGDVDALEELYVVGSAAGRHDRAMLARWVDRGLRVADLEVELLGVAVLAAQPDRLRLRVTDRVAGGRAVGRGVDTPLPRDGPTTRVVTLDRVAGEWRVAKVV